MLLSGKLRNYSSNLSYFENDPKKSQQIQKSTKKSRICETKHLSTNAESSNNTKKNPASKA